MLRQDKPYLKSNRLADLIAALQVMGSHERPEAKIARWAERFEASADPQRVARWRAIFTEHPEFFLVYELRGEEKAALRWRYARKYFDSKTNEEFTPAEAAALEPERQELLTSKPLDQSQLQTLISTAIELHSKSIAERQEGRWLRQSIITTGLGLVSTVVGVLLGLFVTLVTK
jgi:hypothetical protein